MTNVSINLLVNNMSFNKMLVGKESRHQERRRVSLGSDRVKSNFDFPHGSKKEKKEKKR